MIGVDLFCGAGGAALGMEWAGVDVLSGVDRDGGFTEDSEGGDHGE